MDKSAILFFCSVIYENGLTRSGVIRSFWWSQGCVKVAPAAGVCPELPVWNLDLWILGQVVKRWKWQRTAVHPSASVTCGISCLPKANSPLDVCLPKSVPIYQMALSLNQMTCYQSKTLPRSAEVTVTPEAAHGFERQQPATTQPVIMWNRLWIIWGQTVGLLHIKGGVGLIS